MNFNEIEQKLIDWMVDFVEKPNPLLNNWAPCPFARQARINNKIEIQYSDIDTLISCVNNSLPLLDHKEVVVVCFDHTQIDATSLQEIVCNLNKKLMESNKFSYTIDELKNVAPITYEEIWDNYDDGEENGVGTKSFSIKEDSNNLFNVSKN
jgi:hypothetical protein